MPWFLRHLFVYCTPLDQWRAMVRYKCLPSIQQSTEFLVRLLWWSLFGKVYVKPRYGGWSYFHAVSICTNGPVFCIVQLGPPHFDRVCLCIGIGPSLTGSIWEWDVFMNKRPHQCRVHTDPIAPLGGPVVSVYEVNSARPAVWRVIKDGTGTDSYTYVASQTS